jgi:signal peptidase
VTSAPAIRFWAGIVSFFVLNLCLWLVAWVIVPSIGLGLDPTAVRTGSMRPQIEPGDLVMIRASDGVDLGPGTVIRFEQDGPATLHRIQAVEPDGSYITKGDANGTADQPRVRPESVRGAGVLLVPVAGWWFLQREQAPALVIAGTALIMICLAIAAFQALDPRNDPWLNSRYVGRRVAARITATRPAPAARHLLDPARVVVLENAVNASVGQWPAARVERLRRSVPVAGP